MDKANSLEKLAISAASLMFIGLTAFFAYDLKDDQYRARCLNEIGSNLAANAKIEFGGSLNLSSQFREYKTQLFTYSKD